MSDFDGVRDIPFMGVIYVVAEAAKLGFRNGDPEWSNLGQGQPEVGPLEGAPPRISWIALENADHAYGPVNGTDALRERIADHYNRLYRQGRRSQYTLSNVSVASGGRTVLSRAFCALAEGNVGFQTPDYTAYEDLFNYQTSRLTPVCLTGSPELGFAIPASRLRIAIEVESLSAFIFSNPCNPTGAVVSGAELQGYCLAAREQKCTIFFDEFYSHFHYEADGAAAAGPISAAEYVDDVDEDPVVIIDGLTKSFRYPGWRVGWAVGPRRIVEALGRVASATDGGIGQPIQRAALDVLEPERADCETRAVRDEFACKRNLMVSALERMGIEIPSKPRGTFYVWGRLSKLARPYDNAESFFRGALDRRVLTVPGRFFDIRPCGMKGADGRFDEWMRFSFGPPRENVQQGLRRLAEMVTTSRTSRPLEPAL